MHNNQIKFILEQISMVPLLDSIPHAEVDILWIQDLIIDSYDMILSFADDAVDRMTEGYSVFDNKIKALGVIERLNRYWCSSIEIKFNQLYFDAFVYELGNTRLIDHLINTLISHLRDSYYRCN